MQKWALGISQVTKKLSLCLWKPEKWYLTQLSQQKLGGAIPGRCNYPEWTAAKKPSSRALGTFASCFFHSRALYLGAIFRH